MQFRLSRLFVLICLGLTSAAPGRSGALGAPELSQAASPPEATAGDSEQITNPMCPVLTDEEVDPGISTEYQGHRVYFCCQKCRRLFIHDPEQYTANLVAFRSQDSHDEGHEHAEVSVESASLQEDHANDHDAGGEGDHAHHHESDLPPFLTWLGKFHPATVHFPIGLLLSAVIAEFLFVTTRRKWFDDAGRFCLWVGTIGAVVAATLGWLFGGLHLVDDDWLLTAHRWVGTATAVVALFSLFFSERSQWREPAGGRGRLRLALALIALLVSAAGFLGGAMVYGIDHYSW